MVLRLCRCLSSNGNYQPLVSRFNVYECILQTQYLIFPNTFISTFFIRLIHRLLTTNRIYSLFTQVNLSKYFKKGNHRLQLAWVKVKVTRSYSDLTCEILYPICVGRRLTLLGGMLALLRLRETVYLSVSLSVRLQCVSYKIPYLTKSKRCQLWATQ